MSLELFLGVGMGLVFVTIAAILIILQQERNNAAKIVNPIDIKPQVYPEPLGAPVASPEPFSRQPRRAGRLQTTARCSPE